MEPSNALPATASLPISDVMVIAIVAICQTKLIAHQDSLAVATVPSHDSNVPITCVSPCQTSATELMIAVIILMKPLLFARTSIAIRCDASSVLITDASHAIKSATASTTVVTAAMKTT